MSENNLESQKVVIALDLGTTGNRAIAFSRDGEIKAQCYRKFTQLFPQPGWVEHNPIELYETARDVLAEVIHVCGADSVQAIGITNQRETSIVWNKATAQPLYNAIVWQDRRTNDFCASLSGSRKMVKEKTGLFIDPYFSATKIQWILDYADAKRSRCQKGEILFGTPETWVLWNLTGGAVHATEPSNASRTMLFDIHALAWDAQLLKLFNVPSSILPQVLDSDSYFGHTEASLFGREIPIYGMIGDQQASLFGQSGWDSKTIKATYGTGIFILTNTNSKIAQSDTLISTVAWKTRDGAAYAMEGSLFMGGASIQWLQENLGIIGNAAETANAAIRANSNEGVYFVPAFQGLGAPYWAPDARALLIGLSRKSNRDTVIRAALESMAYQVRDVLDEFAKASGHAAEEIRVDGGATQNDFLMQFQADILGIPVIRPAVTETTALGAAALAGISCGFWDRKSFAATLKIDKTFLPLEDQKHGDKLYAGWKEAVKRSLGWEKIMKG